MRGVVLRVQERGGAAGDRQDQGVRRDQRGARAFSSWNQFRRRRSGRRPVCWTGPASRSRESGRRASVGTGVAMPAGRRQTGAAGFRVAESEWRRGRDAHALHHAERGGVEQRIPPGRPDRVVGAAFRPLNSVDGVPAAGNGNTNRFVAWSSSVVDTRPSPSGENVASVSVVECTSPNGAALPSLTESCHSRTSAPLISRRAKSRRTTSAAGALHRARPSSDGRQGRYRQRPARKSRGLRCAQTERPHGCHRAKPGAVALPANVTCRSDDRPARSYTACEARPSVSREHDTLSSYQLISSYQTRIQILRQPRSRPPRARAPRPVLRAPCLPGTAADPSASRTALRRTRRRRSGGRQAVPSPAPATCTPPCPGSHPPATPSCSAWASSRALTSDGARSSKRLREAEVQHFDFARPASPSRSPA